jgi:uncharacterized membrane protein
MLPAGLGQTSAMDNNAGRSPKPTARLRDLLDLAGIVIAVGLIGVVAEGHAGIARVALALAFMFFVPGRAVVSNWPRLAYWSQFGMSMVLSLAILTLLATTFLWVHAWQPVTLFFFEAGLSAAALIAGMLRRHRGVAAGTSSD